MLIINVTWFLIAFYIPGISCFNLIKKISHELRKLMAYRNLCFKNVRFYRGLGTLSCDCRGFVVEIAVLEKCKPNKIKGLAIQRPHRRELIVAGERVLTGGVYILTFCKGCYLAAFTFPCFLRYRVTTFWLSNWYSCPVGSVDRCTPCEP